MCLISALFYPVIAATVIIAVDFLEWKMAAYEEYDVSTVLVTFAIWFVICLPSTLFGGA